MVSQLYLEGVCPFVQTRAVASNYLLHTGPKQAFPPHLHYLPQPLSPSYFLLFLMCVQVLPFFVKERWPIMHKIMSCLEKKFIKKKKKDGQEASQQARSLF